jgi:hypothetical protein
MPQDDPLLSVNDVARLWGTGLQIVVTLVESGQLASLDRGLLVRQGEHYVPLYVSHGRRHCGAHRRGPRACSIRRAGSLSTLRSRLPSNSTRHWAHRMQSASTSTRLQPREQTDRRKSCSSHGPRSVRTSSITTPVWEPTSTLAPHEAVAARVIANAPAMPRAVSKPTPAMLVDALPLVFEDDHWRVDLPMFQRRLEWIHLLSEPPPGSSSSPASSER